MKIVVDASVLIAFVLPEETGRRTAARFIAACGGLFSDLGRANNQSVPRSPSKLPTE